ncbi:hypothetical protein [Stomatohabitans albus]|uniref:hypothetical protein n=2 Tax=Stomatohabitans albus TaxID=3110766 RepID=UPI00300D0FC6
MFTLSEAQAKFDEIVKTSADANDQVPGLIALLAGPQDWLETAKTGDEQAQEFAGVLTHFLATAIGEHPRPAAAIADLLSVLEDDEDGVRLYLVQNMFLDSSPAVLATARQVVEPKQHENELYLHLTGGIIRLQGDPEEFEAFVKANTPEMGDEDWFRVSELYVTADRPEEALERLDKITDEQALWPDTAVIRHAAYRQLDDTEKMQALARTFFVAMPIPVAYHMISLSWPDIESQQQEAERLVGLITQTPELNPIFVSTLLNLEQEPRAAEYVHGHYERLSDAGLGALATWTDAFTEAQEYLAAYLSVRAAMACLDEVDPSQRDMVGDHLIARAEELKGQIKDWKGIDVG